MYVLYSIGGGNRATQSNTFQSAEVLNRRREPHNTIVIPNRPKSDLLVYSIGGGNRTIQSDTQPTNIVSAGELNWRR